MSQSIKEKQQPPVVRTQARAEINDQYRIWGKARVTFSKETYDRMLAEDFFCQLPTQQLDRKAFIDLISATNPKMKLTRFDCQIISLTKEEEEWVAVITEKIEYETKDPDGNTAKIYNVWVTRDGWRQKNDQWQIAYSEAIGSEYWAGQKPPITGWSY